MYFPPRNGAPSSQQFQVEANAFVKWLSKPSTLPGDRYTIRYSSKFGGHSPEVKGYRLSRVNGGSFDDGMRLTKTLNDVGSEILQIKRDAKAKAYMKKAFPDRTKSSGSGLSLGLNNPLTPNNPLAPSNKKPLPKKEEPDQVQSKELLKLRDHLNSASPVLMLKDLNYKFALTNLQGDLQTYELANQAALQPNQQNEPIFPVLRMSHQIILPEASKLQPGNLEFEIELEFQIKSATAQDTPPEIFDSKIVGKYGKQLQREDQGKYVIFEAVLSNAWLIDPKTNKRNHKLTLIPVSNNPS